MVTTTAPATTAATMTTMIARVTAEATMIAPVTVAAMMTTTAPAMAAAMTTDVLVDESHQDNRLPSESSADPRPETPVVSQGRGPGS
jgi:hypothetical protein